MMTRRSLLSKLLAAPFLGLLPKRSGAWAESQRLFAELVALPCSPVVAATSFELVCHVEHRAVDAKFLGSALGCVNAGPFLSKEAGRFLFDGFTWARSQASDGNPGPDVLTYTFSLNRDDWGPDYPAADFGRFPLTGITGAFTATPYRYGSFFPRPV